MVHNTWVIDFIDATSRSGWLRLVARSGFLEAGRGAIALSVDRDDKLSIKFSMEYYKCEFWRSVNLDDDRKKPILEYLDIYEPLTQAIVVATSPLGDKMEVTTCLIKLN